MTDGLESNEVLNETQEAVLHLEAMAATRHPETAVVSAERVRELLHPRSRFLGRRQQPFYDPTEAEILRDERRPFAERIADALALPPGPRSSSDVLVAIAVLERAHTLFEQADDRPAIAALIAGLSVDAHEVLDAAGVFTDGAFWPLSQFDFLPSPTEFRDQFVSPVLASDREVWRQRASDMAVLAGIQERSQSIDPPSPGLGL